MQNEGEQPKISGMGMSGINGSLDLVGNDGQKIDVKIGAVGYSKSGLDVEIISASRSTKEQLSKNIQEVIEEDRSIRLINPYAGLSPLLSYSPFASKKRNTNRTAPKKKRKKK